MIVDTTGKLIDDSRDGTPLLADVRHLVVKAAVAMSESEALDMPEKAQASVEERADADTFVGQDSGSLAEHAGL